MIQRDVLLPTDKKRRHTCILKLTLMFPWKSIFTGANAVAFNLSTIHNAD